MTSLEFNEGQMVEYNGEQFTIAKRPTDAFEVLLRCNKRNKNFRVPIPEVKLSTGEERKIDEPRPIESLTDKEKAQAEERFEIIKPLLADRGNKQAVLDMAAKSGNSKSTLYDWISRYEMYGGIIGLVDKPGRGKKGVSRLSESVYKLMLEVIDNGLQIGSTFRTMYMDLWDRCEEQNYKVPHENTFRAQIKQFDAMKKMAAQKGPRTAEQHYGDAATPMHQSIAPLHWVEIDHTIADVMLVSDDNKRKTVGRPWVTFLIDVFSRCILGFYVSFDAPGAFGTGKAIVHAMLPKDKWLTDFELDAKLWPCWGKMKNIRCDNAKEFKGNMLIEASKAHGMNFEFRAPKRPKGGAYIERFMGTFGTWLKDIKGTTAVSKELRAFGKPEKTAALTLEEFKKWLTLAIAIYHRDYHSGIHMPPLDKWNDGLFNKATGIGLPGVVQDDAKLRLDFLPFVKRTVQRTGVKIGKVFYWGDMLRNYVNAVDDEVKGKHGSRPPKKEFIFKIDPRDISKIYFLHPTQHKYYEIAFAKMGGPSMSVWDYRRAYNQLKANGDKINQDSIFAMHRKLKALEETANKTTKAAQKSASRKKEKEREEKLDVEKTNSDPLMYTSFKLNETEIKPFEIDYGKKAFI